MNNSNRTIDFGKVAGKIFEVLIVKIFTLPFIIYKTALLALSNSGSQESEESLLKADFPLYTWYISTFNAFIVLVYPLGVAGAIFIGVTAGSYSPFGGGFAAFLIVLIYTYFLPLALGFLREALLITIKALSYLKIISQK